MKQGMAEDKRQNRISLVGKDQPPAPESASRPRIRARADVAVAARPAMLPAGGSDMARNRRGWAALGLLAADARGTFHLAGGGEASWWELARACLDASGFADVPIERIATSDLELAAPRPAYSVLDCGRAKALGVELRDWRDALAAYLASPESPTAEEAS